MQMATYQTAHEQQNSSLPHRLTLDERKKLTVSGVTEVLSFDSDSVLLKTVKGLLSVHGEELKLHALSPDAGAVEVSGQIDQLNYTTLREGGFLRRLFG